MEDFSIGGKRETGTEEHGDEPQAKRLRTEPYQAAPEVTALLDPGERWLQQYTYQPSPYDLSFASQSLQLLQPGQGPLPVPNPGQMWNATESGVRDGSPVNSSNVSAILGPGASTLTVTGSTATENISADSFISPHKFGGSYISSSVGSACQTPELSPKHPEPRIEVSSSSHDTRADKSLASQEQFDTCFGVIIAKPTGTFKPDEVGCGKPLTIKPSGDIVKLSYQDPPRYAGLLILPSLSRLEQRFNIRLSASISTETTLDQKSTKKPKKRNKGTAKADAQAQVEVTVRILIYGLSEDSVAIGNFLSDAGLYLQHPYTTEYNRNLDYHNPHYLTRPGGGMPPMEDLNLGSDGRAEPEINTLDEIAKSRLLRIFDAANGVDISASDLEIYAGVGVSPRLNCTLLPRFKPADLEFFSGFRHIIAGHDEDNLPPLNGGILADDMGLGESDLLSGWYNSSKFGSRSNVKYVHLSPVAGANDADHQSYLGVARADKDVTKPPIIPFMRL
ncbi:hypothetical protein M406DRAFT_66510 [Cryphonectria parasitica EP155]|uniref:Uncharacterized protein n=1 Tax=Cryphonectria parasitica (strain ATCC 38755 / EP155) TaxID=660469 RepID=A0A9P4YBL7_CRYP1|nr:uncharacterized protein M406DRAFT_66510 [Cryphonectria parasitica EP155]KAF3770063.1 hypothetical protein M406DRAFT_66510 [Cryphonectria parasitica EP155]